MKPAFCFRLAVLCALLAGCKSVEIRESESPALLTASNNVAESELLDIEIVVFDPGLENIDSDLIFPDVRKAEAVFIPTQLANTLVDQGSWGAVRVVPRDRQSSDLSLSGKILHSDGQELAISVKVVDARGLVWLDKRYQGVTNKHVYNQSTINSRDPFLGVYRKVANDLLAALELVKIADRRKIRQIAEIRFARDFSSVAFSDYLERNDSGFLSLRRLPAEDDPMLSRIRVLRQRHHIFVDTLQVHYDSFSEQMSEPYDEWRKKSWEELDDLRRLERESQQEIIAGGVAIVGGILASTSDNRATRTAGTVGVMGGGALIKSGVSKRNQAKVSSLTLEEFGQDLGRAVTPRTVELQDRTVRLTGSVEDQYDQWRELLADIYAAELAALEPPAGAADNTTATSDAQDS